MNTAFVIPVQDVIVPRNDPAVGSRLNLMEGSIVLEQEHSPSQTLVLEA